MFRTIAFPVVYYCNYSLSRSHAPFRRSKPNRNEWNFCCDKQNYPKLKPNTTKFKNSSSRSAFRRARWFAFDDRRGGRGQSFHSSTALLPPLLLLLKQTKNMDPIIALIHTHKPSVIYDKVKPVSCAFFKTTQNRDNNKKTKRIVNFRKVTKLLYWTPQELEEKNDFFIFVLIFTKWLCLFFT